MNTHLMIDMDDADPSLSTMTTLSKILTQAKKVLPQLLLISALMAMLAWLGYQSASYDSKGEQDIRAQIGQLKETDALLDVATLEAKIGLSVDYDELTLQYNSLLMQTKAILLASNTLHLDGNASAKLQEKMAAKGALLDKFKAQHALYRNSLKYLPQSVAKMRELAVRQHAGKKVNDLARAILGLSLDYAINEDESKAQTLRMAAVRLAAVDGLPENVDDARRELVIHVYSVISQKSAETQLFQDLALIQFRGQVDAVATHFQQHFDTEQQTAQLYRVGLIVFSALLLVVLGVLSYRLIQSFRVINLANVTLEDNVSKRTTDLNHAVQQLQTQQAQIIQQEKMASLGQMVAGIAHEINTPLGYLRSGLQSAQTSIPLFSQLSQAVEQMIATMTSEHASSEDIERDLYMVQGLAVMVREEDIVDEIDQLLKNGLFGVDQISEIVANLKDFSRLDSKSSVNYNTTDCIESTLRIATNVIKKVTIKKNVSTVPTVDGFPSQINQVLLNLITNACHATDHHDQGVVSIAQTFDEQAKAIKIDISDNGAGIPRDIISKIFDPFFTTKKVGQGTGLGLHISRQIVEAHKGKISVASVEGEGTTFTILLPVC